MSVLGPGGSGTMPLIYAILNSPSNFDPSNGKNYYFWKTYQPLFKQMAKKLDIEYVSCLDFNINKKLAN